MRSPSIACGESGQLYYQFAGGAQFENYAVYSDDTLSRTVIAEANIVNGPEASAMADSWRIAYDWAQRDPKTRRLAVTAVDDDEVPAQFSSSGYMDARGKVLDACVQGIVELVAECRGIDAQHLRGFLHQWLGLVPTSRSSDG